MKRYFYGIVSYFFRIVTKKRVKKIPIGIPVFSCDVLGISVEQRHLVVSRQFRGFRGSVKINDIPPTTIPQNNMRKAWVGIRVRGFLISPNNFLATSESCFEELKKKGELEYINFLQKTKADFFLFINCFQKFKKEK